MELWNNGIRFNRKVLHLCDSYTTRKIISVHKFWSRPDVDMKKKIHVYTKVNLRSLFNATIVFFSRNRRKNWRKKKKALQWCVYFYDCYDFVGEKIIGPKVLRSKFLDWTFQRVVILKSHISISVIFLRVKFTTRTLNIIIHKFWL